MKVLKELPRTGYVYVEKWSSRDANFTHCAITVENVPSKAIPNEEMIQFI